jgi:hypothetical protein
MSLNGQVIARNLETDPGALSALGMRLMARLARKNMHHIIHQPQRNRQDTRQIATDLP